MLLSRIFQCFTILLLIYTTEAIPVFSEHPMLFFSSKDILPLQSKARTTHKKISQIIEDAGNELKSNPGSFLPPESFEKFGMNWNEHYGNNLCTFAMYCVLYPDDKKAIDLVKVMMDRMASYPDWYVTSSRGLDEVPIGHSLTGFTIAFDFLYDKLEQNRQQLYLQKIKQVTSEMHVIAQNFRRWSSNYIHNHAPTNLLSIFLGGLVVEIHDATTGSFWKNNASELLDRGMFFLRFVSDGSNDEGVAYGTYAARGMYQYIFLALRHLGVNHTNNPWLKKQFWFYFSTLMPGYKRTVGIADSNHNWFHGPLSQLVFLDKYVLRNGYGNWLADKIRNERTKNNLYDQGRTHKWSTTYTEFIFYDETIEPRKPTDTYPFHIFHDWGVVTYGGGKDDLPGNTFLSFKSGSLHGEGISEIIKHKLFRDILTDKKYWRYFNPGHEHPDQNSFVFTPNGRYFITESLYGPKYSHLNNILTFAPSQHAICNKPWVGQLGECSKWLDFTNVPIPEGKIITATSSDSMLHLAGEAVGAYNSKLGLQSVQRSLILLSPELLVVVDGVYLKQGSSLNRSSAFFQNIEKPFFLHETLGFNGAQVIYPEGNYKFLWFQPDGNSPVGKTEEEIVPSESKPRKTHYVNVTFSLRSFDEVTRMAYIFYSPNVSLTSASFLPNSNDKFAYLKVKANEVEYKMTLASLMLSAEERMKVLGFGGYLLLHRNNHQHRFGMDDNITSSSYKSSDNHFSKFTRSGFYQNSFMPTRTCVYNAFLINWPWTVLLVAVIMFYFQVRKSKRQSRILKICIIGLLFVFILMLWFTCGKEKETNLIQRQKIASNVIITSLPGSGAELLKTVFQNSTDFVYLSSDDVVVPADDDTANLDRCCWPSKDIENYVTTAGWFFSMATEPLIFLNNLPERSSEVQLARKRFRQAGKRSKFVLNLLSGFWNTKLPWIQDKLGDNCTVIYVVRDPRDWIYSLIRKDLNDKQETTQQAVIKRLVHQKACLPPSWIAKDFVSLENEEEYSLVEKLAKIWRASLLSVLQSGVPMQFIRFEDIISEPENTATSMLRQMGLTISVPQISKLTRTVHSGIYNISYEGPIHENYSGQWKEKMSDYDVKRIQKICHDVMKKFSYL